MDILVGPCAVALVVLAVLIVFVGPFNIGEKSEYTVGKYLGGLAQAVCMIIVAGRIFGWW